MFSSGNGIHLADSFFVGFGDGASGRPDFQIGFGGTNLDIRCGNGADTADISIDANGRLGIGTTSPSEKLVLANSSNLLKFGLDGSSHDIFSNGKTFTLDHREKAPSNSYRDMFLDESGSVIPGMSLYSRAGSGVPGTSRSSRSKPSPGGRAARRSWKGGGRHAPTPPRSPPRAPGPVPRRQAR